jgi:hypothetical protein
MTGALLILSIVVAIGAVTLYTAMLPYRRILHANRNSDRTRVRSKAHAQSFSASLSNLQHKVGSSVAEDAHNISEELPFSASLGNEQGTTGDWRQLEITAGKSS